MTDTLVKRADGGWRGSQLRSPLTNLKSEQYDFGLIDSRKRKIGCAVHTWEETWVAAEQGEPNSWYGNPGHKFGLSVHNRRNGISYGASQGSRFFDSETARDRALLKYLNDAQKRFAKQFAAFNFHT